MLSTDSEKVTEILSLAENELSLSAGDVEETLGAVVSIVNELEYTVISTLSDKDIENIKMLNNIVRNKII